LETRGAVPGDLFLLASELQIAPDVAIHIKDLTFNRISLDQEDLDLSTVTFRECVFDSIEIGAALGPDHCPMFDTCLISEIEGRVGQKDLPFDRFKECDCEGFRESALTTSSTLELSIPMPAKLALTVLKKLFLQSLNGRKENALYRGLPLESRRRVPDVLEMLQRQGLIVPSNRGGESIWLPVRQTRERVLKILNAPMGSSDPAMLAAWKL